jgi:hypothetical protein
MRQMSERIFDRAALVDVDGVLADMGAFEHLVCGDDRRWREFFARFGEAAPIPAGIALVNALTEAGIKVRYSTTRPPWTVRVTYEWLAAQGLPGGYLYSRQRRTAQESTTPYEAPAVVKLSHVALLREHRPERRFVAFVDDEPDIVQELCANRVPAYRFSDLAAFSPGQLSMLDVPAFA